jgi:AcrR family transcriptional regulator
MNDEIAGRGDPLKTLALLWPNAQPKRRGPKPKVTVTEIVTAAIRIADAEGLDAVSTRRVADAVGISAMSFYTHIPGKAELIDLMLDAVAGIDFGPDDPTFEPREWRKNLTEIATGLWGFYLVHPWVLQIATHRPVIGPNTLRASNIALSAIDGCGLADLEMDRVFTLIVNYVHGAVRDAARQAMVDEATGMTDTEWWYRVEPFLNTLDFSPWPVMARVGKAAGEAYGAIDPKNSFDFGLERILDGLELFIAPRLAAAIDGAKPSA